MTVFYQKLKPKFSQENTHLPAPTTRINVTLTARHLHKQTDNVENNQLCESRLELI